MGNKNLFAFCLIFSLVGIFCLLIILENQEVKLYNINEITEDLLESNARINGTIKDYFETQGLYILTVEDRTGEIKIVVFKDEKPLAIEKNLLVEIEGEIVEYEGELELQAKKIKIV